MPKLWLFDLDDTLFEASGGMLHKIHLLMNEYMCRELGMEWEEASALRRHYWSVYGATFLGLWRHHGIDPRDFLSFAHDFDPRLYIQFSGCPAEDVKRLPGRKVVFTNGPRNYARAVLEALELDHVVDGLVASTDMHALGQWRPKPSRLMFLMTCRRWGVSPADTVFVDDSPMNLMAAPRRGDPDGLVHGVPQEERQACQPHRASLCGLYDRAHQGAFPPSVRNAGRQNF